MCLRVAVLVTLVIPWNARKNKQCVEYLEYSVVACVKFCFEPLKSLCKGAFHKYINKINKQIT